MIAIGIRYGAKITQLKCYNHGRKFRPHGGTSANTFHTLRLSMQSNQKVDSERHPSGLDVIENDDGSFTFEWDEKDPRWTFLNDLTSEDIIAILEHYLSEDNDGSAD